MHLVNMEIPGMDFCPVRKKYFPKGKVPALPNVLITDTIVQNSSNAPYQSSLLCFNRNLWNKYVPSRNLFLKNIQLDSTNHNIQVCPKYVCRSSMFTVVADSNSLSVIGGGFQLVPLQSSCITSSKDYFFVFAGNGQLICGRPELEPSSLASLCISYAFGCSVSCSAESVLVYGEGLEVWDTTNLCPQGGVSFEDFHQVQLSGTAIYNEPFLFATGSRQRNVCLWDIRQPLSLGAAAICRNVSEGAVTGVTNMYGVSNRFAIRSTCGSVSVVDFRVASEQASALMIGGKKKKQEGNIGVGRGMGRGVISSFSVPFKEGGGGGQICTLKGGKGVAICGGDDIWMLSNCDEQNIYEAGFIKIENDMENIWRGVATDVWDYENPTFFGNTKSQHFITGQAVYDI